MHGAFFFLKVVWTLYSVYRSLEEELRKPFLKAVMEDANQWFTDLEKAMEKAKNDKDPTELSRLMSNRPTRMRDNPD
jgi:hypothetical protein